MEPKKILVIGSSNTDMVIRTKTFPKPGETILGGKFLMNPGGKGANQAVAAARLGGIVSFVGKIGDDIFGKQAVQLMEDEGIDVENVALDTGLPSGVAMITVDAKGENSIVVAPGSNGSLNFSDIEKAMPDIIDSDIILMQLEVPLQIVDYVAKIGKKHSKMVILNPAPAAELPVELYKNISVITPNENEAELLTGVKVNDEESAIKAALCLQKKGVETVIITLGSRGALLFSSKAAKIIPSPKVKTIDTTAAGDTFNGALAVALSEGKEFGESVKFANKAAALTVTKMGAQSSIPYKDEII